MTREPRQPLPGPEPPREDVVAAGEPEVERRHRLRRVLVDQRRERVHVVLLERRDVAAEELLVGARRRTARSSTASASLASSVARARWSALFTDATLVSSSSATSRRLPAQHLAEDQDRALARRQLLERGDEREPHRLARRRRSRAGSPSGDDEAVGHRLDPELVGRAQVLDDRRAGGPEIHRACTPLAALEHVEADVRRDAVEPRAQRRAALEALEAPRQARMNVSCTASSASTEPSMR